MRYLILLMLAVSGCGTIVEGVRLAPQEPLKQQGTMAAQLAQAGLLVPLEPGSPAANALAQSTGAVDGYIGTPDSPLAVQAMLEAERQKFVTGIENKVKTEIMLDWTARGVESLSKQMAELAACYSQSRGKSVTTATVISDMEAIGQSAAAFFIGAESIQLEGVDNDLEAQALRALDDIKKSVEAARVEANKRLTAGELSEKVQDSADGVLAQIGDVASKYGVELMGVPVLGGLVYGAKKRKQVKEAEERADANDKKAVKAEAKIEAASKVVNEALGKLADAQPPA